MSQTIDSSADNSGAEKLIAMAPASGIRLKAMTVKVCEIDCDRPRAMCARGRRVANTDKPVNGRMNAGADEQRDERAEEHHLADRIDRDQPFRHCRRKREQDRRGNHAENAARHVVLRLDRGAAAGGVGGASYDPPIEGSLALRLAERDGKCAYIQPRASTTPLMRLQSDSLGAVCIGVRLIGTMRLAILAISATNRRRSSCAFSSETGSNEIFDPIGTRPSAGMSAETTVAIFGYPP